MYMVIKDALHYTSNTQLNRGESLLFIASVSGYGMQFLSSAQCEHHASPSRRRTSTATGWPREGASTVGACTSGPSIAAIGRPPVPQPRPASPIQDVPPPPYAPPPFRTDPGAGCECVRPNPQIPPPLAAAAARLHAGLLVGEVPPLIRLPPPFLLIPALWSGPDLPARSRRPHFLCFFIFLLFLGCSARAMLDRWRISLAVGSARRDPFVCRVVSAHRAFGRLFVLRLCVPGR